MNPDEQQDQEELAAENTVIQSNLEMEVAELTYLLRGRYRYSILYIGVMATIAVIIQILILFS